MDNKSWIIAVTLFIAVTAFSLIIIPDKDKKDNPTDSLDSINLALPQDMKTTPSPSPNKQQLQQEAINGQTYSDVPELQIDLSKSYQAKMQTSVGLLTIDLFTTDAPITVNNFTFLSREGFYNNTIFHRIIKDFMVQGGDPKGDGTGGPGYKFKDEPITRNYARGIVAMANSGPNTNGSQFFIVTKDNSSLAKNYTIFGKLTGDKSFQTLDIIAASPVTVNPSGEKSKPLSQISIQSIKVEEISD